MNPYHLLLTLALVLVGCTQEPAPGGTPEQPAAEPGGAGLPETLFVNEALADPQGVGALKESAKGGETVVVRGRIGGTVPPFTQGRAIMTIADTDNVTDCKSRSGDRCPRPWDYCCEDPDTLLANIATVTVTDEAGKILPVGLEGKGGLEPLDVIVIEGTVAERPDPASLEIVASKIYVEQ